MDKESTPKEPVSEQKDGPESAPAVGNTPTDDSSSANVDTSQPAAAPTAAETDGEKEQPAQPTPERGGKETHVDIESARADTLNIATEMNNIYNYLPEPGSQETIRQFSVNDCWPITDAKENEVARLLVADSSEIEAMLCVLADKRILVISGAPETGKATTAIYLGKKLAEADLSAIEGSTYLVPSLGRQLSLDLLNDRDFARADGELKTFADAVLRKY
jgi:hypothetical protein